MPQLQVIDTTPAPRAPTTLENILSSAAQEYNKVSTARRESDALGAIYKRYQEEGQGIEKTLMDIQRDPQLSPTTRVNTANQLLQLHKTNAALQKETLKKQEAVVKEENKTRELARQRNLLEKAGATEQQLDLFEAATVGGQTEVVKNITQDILRKTSKPQNLPEDVEDVDVGLTPDQRFKRQEERYKVQTPLVEANSKAVKALEVEDDAIQLLQELDATGKVGVGKQKFNINPKTGDILIPEFATPEEQLFAKTINDFTTKAKDSYGGRVTNFELDRFMQRLPTLANSKEGRALIMRQMRIVNQANQLEKKALQDVFDKYGVRNIDYAEAEKIARKNIEPEIKKLKEENKVLQDLAGRDQEALIEQAKKKAPPGRTVMMTPEGKIMFVGNKHIKKFKEEHRYKEL